MAHPKSPPPPTTPQHHQEVCLFALDVMLGSLVARFNGNARHDQAMMTIFSVEYNVPFDWVHRRVREFIYPQPGELVH
jgi:hypothetical protein